MSGGRGGHSRPGLHGLRAASPRGFRGGGWGVTSSAPPDFLSAPRRLPGTLSPGQHGFRVGAVPWFTPGTARAPGACCLHLRWPPPPERPLSQRPPQHSYGAGSAPWVPGAPRACAAAPWKKRTCSLQPLVGRPAPCSSSPSPEWGGNVGTCGRSRGCS